MNKCFSAHINIGFTADAVLKCRNTEPHDYWLLVGIKSGFNECPLFLVSHELARGRKVKKHFRNRFTSYTTTVKAEQTDVSLRDFVVALRAGLALSDACAQLSR